MKRYYVIFIGQVQGVGFRWVLSRLANELKLTGWVRNLYNGNVECQFQGDDLAIQQLIQRMHTESHYIIIDDYSMKELPLVEKESSFEIKY